MSRSVCLGVEESCVDNSAPDKNLLDESNQGEADCNDGDEGDDNDSHATPQSHQTPLFVIVFSETCLATQTLK